MTPQCHWAPAHASPRPARLSAPLGSNRAAALSRRQAALRRLRAHCRPGPGSHIMNHRARQLVLTRSDPFRGTRRARVSIAILSLRALHVLAPARPVCREIAAPGHVLVTQVTSWSRRVTSWSRKSHLGHTGSRLGHAGHVLVEPGHVLAPSRFATVS